MESAEIIELKDDEQPRMRHKFWASEIASSEKMLRKWHKRGTKIVKRYLDEREETDNSDVFRLNLFHSNVKTITDMLYSSLPKVEVSRANADAADDIARVAAEVAERVINLDIAENGQEYDSVLRAVLQDRMLPGLGCARVRYDVEMEEVEVPDQLTGEITIEQQIVSEAAPVDYYHWQDVMWGWGRSFAELPWIAFRSYLSKQEVRERFGEEYCDDLEWGRQKMADTKESEWTDPDNDSPWDRAEIWEIWDKISRNVIWFSPGAGRLLDVKADTLQLKQFFPCPPFLLANPTTALYRPTPDFIIAQDLYNSIDELQTRINTITEAVRVVGVYDASADGVKRMLQEGCENELIPVEEWALFAESGGLRGKVDWLPLQDVVATLGQLQQIRDEQIKLLQQITGMADVMQGQLNSPYEGVGQSQMKAQFGSVRVQALQDQFAQFASDLLQLKLEIICRHFEAETIVTQSAMQYSADAELVPQAVQLLKQPEQARFRVVVRPETVAMVDYARLKVERTEFLNAMATYMQSAAPLLEQDQSMMPYLIKMLQWTMAGFKGSQEIEGVLDKAFEQAVQNLQQQQQQEEQPDPEQIKLQGEMQKIQAKAQADMQLRQVDAQADQQTILATHQAKMAEIKATHVARITEIQQKLQADIYKEQVAVQGDIAQTQASTQGEMEKDEMNLELELAKEAGKAKIELEKEASKSVMDMDKIQEASELKIREMMAQPNESDNDDED